MVHTRATACIPRECVSCWQWLPTIDFPEEPPTHGCEHESDICINCVQEWIHISVQNQYQPRIDCPQPGCDSFMLGGADLRRLAVMKDYDRFMEKVRSIARDMNPSWRQCLNTDCNSGELHVSPAPESELQTDVFHCVWSCQSKACVKCDRPWHEGQSCEGFNESIASQREQEVADREYVERLKRDGEVKECPNCACNVTREIPAEVMRCSRCFYYIRWTAPTEAKTKKIARVSSGGEALSVTFAEDV